MASSNQQTYGDVLTSNISPLTSQKKYAIIVAGGSGSRMQSPLPKQFLLLCGRPVLMHTMGAFHNCESQPEIILVLPSAFHAYWQQLCADHQFNIPHQLVNGGETRFHSVKNGLELISDAAEALVAVHDAARPLISPQIIDRAYQYAAEHGNAITAVKCRDSVRRVVNDVSRSLLRDEIYLVQTPQIFKSSQIIKAYAQPYQVKFTDDAGVVEETGIKIELIEGSYRNIKITMPEDILLAEALLSMHGS
ncbi:2-C-methyl-D-erythritol 4-phosphate cytidylyltransferase [soil metagenome]|jgi:2-C-methyl-D-erythritol 4-phosphate cytidylyltransferase